MSRKIKIYRTTEETRQLLNSKSPSFCAAKWYNASMWLDKGWTTSCHHNPVHSIDVNEIRTNFRALHNTQIKKNERRMMQQGEKPINCQFCWIMESTAPEQTSDRVWSSLDTPTEAIDRAYTNSHEDDYDLEYLELCFDRTCNLACSYCCPAISSSWARDVRQHGPYKDLVTDHRQHYISASDEFILHKYGEPNPYVDAFFQWWNDSLHRTLNTLKISGGEPLMSGNTWRLLEWLADNPNKSTTELHLTTNLAYDSDTLSRFLLLADRIDQPIIVNASLECIGKKAEYVRDGLVWEQWLDNFNRLVDCKGVEKIGLVCTASALSSDGFVEFLEWLLTQKPRRPFDGITLTLNPVRFPTFQNIIALPHDIRLIHAAELEKFITNNPEYERWYTDYEKDNLSRYLIYLKKLVVPHKEEQQGHDDTTFEEHDREFSQEELARDLKTFCVQYDQRRGKNFIEAFPRLKNWYENI